MSSGTNDREEFEQDVKQVCEQHISNGDMSKDEMSNELRAIKTRIKWGDSYLDL